MAEINLGNDETINATLYTEEPITSEVLDINYIPGYVVAEQERRANEAIRKSNEADRIALYEDMEAKLESGYFKGDKGDPGETGNGISNISKTSTSGLVDTYTIYYTNGTTSTYNVTNGSDGVTDEETIEICSIIGDFITINNNYLGIDSNTVLEF